MTEEQTETGADGFRHVFDTVEFEHLIQGFPPELPGFRHELAHGTWTPEQVSPGVSLLFLMILLSVSAVSEREEGESRDGGPSLND